VLINDHLHSSTVWFLQLKCPVCGLPVSVPDDAVPGELVDHECGVALEVIVDGGRILLKPFESAGEDWGE
jgi:alpha-aminoadipate carrier protein LysW